MKIEHNQHLDGRSIFFPSHIPDCQCWLLSSLEKVILNHGYYFFHDRETWNPLSGSKGAKGFHGNRLAFLFRQHTVKSNTNLLFIQSNSCRSHLPDFLIQPAYNQNQCLDWMIFVQPFNNKAVLDSTNKYGGTHYLCASAIESLEAHINF